MGFYQISLKLTQSALIFEKMPSCNQKKFFLTSGIFRDKTNYNKLKYIPIDDKQNEPFMFII